MADPQAISIGRDAARGRFNGVVQSVFLCAANIRLDMDVS